MTNSLGFHLFPASKFIGPTGAIESGDTATGSLTNPIWVLVTTFGIISYAR